jgi:LEA14-like dessication related protein
MCQIARTARAPLAAPAAAALAALLVAACAPLQQLSFELPTVELAAVKITHLDLAGGALVLRLDVFNPNSYAISTTRVEATLELEGQSFGTAVLEEATRLAAASHTQLDIPAQFFWEGVGAGARSLLQRGEVGYRLETKMRLQTSLGGRTASLRKSGRVTISDLVP